MTETNEQKLVAAGFERVPVETLSGRRYWRRPDRPGEALTEERALEIVEEAVAT
ncbi:MAG: hypothetical protein AABM43_07885 [Actinomycetota bacterium]